MVKLKFIVKDGALMLRISEGKSRFYRTVSYLIVGKQNYEKSWSEEKQKFTSKAYESTANNEALKKFRDLFQQVIDNYPELSAKQVANYYSGKVFLEKPKDVLNDTNTCSYDYLAVYLGVVIEREKAKAGCNFEVYEKLNRKMEKIMPEFKYMKFQSINYNKCIEIAKEMAKHSGYYGTSKAFRNLLGKAAKDMDVNFSIAQIGDFNFKDYNPKEEVRYNKKPDVLTPEQIKRFLNLDVKKMTPKFTNRKNVELYYDFCVFMFNSFFAPCDVIKLKYENITRAGTIATVRKKTHHYVETPISEAMERIILKYKGMSNDGYLFPIMDDEAEKKHETKDYTFKKFRQKLNVWLKYVGDEIGVLYDLYAYVFRHTAITTALDHGMPISYVAMAAGTSIEMIQKHYYNGDSIVNKDRLKAVFAQVAM